MLDFMIRNCKSFTNGVALKAIYVALVRSCLKYAAFIWYSLVQRRFFKYLCFQTKHRYPERCIDQSILLNQFSFQSLHCRRFSVSIKFLFNLIHGTIDAPELLSLIAFRIPQFSSRMTTAFYTGHSRINITASFPINIMCNNFNLLLPTNFDLYSCSLQAL